MRGRAPDDGAIPCDMDAVLDLLGQGVLVFNKDRSAFRANLPAQTILELPATTGSGGGLAELVAHLRDGGSERGDSGAARFGARVRAGNPDTGALELANGTILRYRIAPVAGATAVILTDVAENRGETGADTGLRRQLEAVLNQIAEGVNIVDGDMNLVLANRGFLDMFGFPADLGAPGTPFSAFVRDRLSRGELIGEFELSQDHTEKDVIAERVRQFGDLGPDGETVRVEERPDGRLIQLRRRRLPDNSVISTYIDVSEQVAATDALKESEARYRVVVEDQTEMICRLDTDFRLTFANRAYWQVFGGKAASVVGRPYLDKIVDATQRDPLLAELHSLSPGDPAVSGTVQAVHADGSVHWHHWTNRALFDDQGGTIGYQAVGRDITAEKEAQAEIERQRIALAQNDKMSALGSILASVSHELNNPLAVVVGQAELLSEMDVDERINQRLSRIRKAANRCARIVRTFLSVARQKPTEQAPFQVNSVIRDALELVDYALDTTGIAPLVTLDADMPELFGDSFQLGQVIVNLLINTQQALADQPKPRLLSVRSRRSARGDMAIVTIADNGPGVADEIKRKIFEPFFTTKAEGAGTGIGLAISHNIVAAHGGQLSVLDTPGGGATFEIRLPIPDHVPEKNKAFVAIAEAVTRSRSARILIVDDEIDIATTIADYLAADGHSCQIATGGKVALTHLQRERFDAVISDIRMPDIDGPALYARAMEAGKAPPFGFVTGDTLGPAAGGFLRDSGLPHIEKPFSREQIVALTDTLLSPAGEPPKG